MEGSWPGSSPIDWKNRFHQMVSLAACARARNSASVLDVVTAFCFVECQSMTPPNSLNRYPSVLRLVAVSSANAASPAHTKTCWLFVPAEYSMAKVLVFCRYEIAWFTAPWCCGDGF